MSFSNRAPLPANQGKEKRKPKSAKSYMIWLLSRQEYSAKNLREKLLSKEFSVEEVDAAIAFAQEYSFQSDERFAHSRARSKGGRQGDWRVKQELMQKGISQELAVEEVAKLDDESARVISLLRKFEGKEMTPEHKNKIYRFLAQRGFSQKSIKAAFSHLKTRFDERDEMSDVA